VASYLVSFIIIQYRVENFIYKRVNKIYDNVTLLDATSLRPHQITTDMVTLTREVEKFAEDKKPDPSRPLIIVPDSMVRVAPLLTTNFPFISQIISLVKVKSSVNNPERSSSCGTSPTVHSHGAQDPPQSTLVSLPFWIPSVQVNCPFGQESSSVQLVHPKVAIANPATINFFIVSINLFILLSFKFKAN